jgi:polyphosphate kinase
MVVVNGVDGKRSRRVMQAQEAVEVHIHRRVRCVVRRQRETMRWWERIGDGGYENRTNDREHEIGLT